MSNEIRSLLIQQQKAFKEFRGANDARLDLLEESGGVDVLTQEEIEKSTKGLAGLREQVREIEKIMGRAGGTGALGGSDMETSKGFDKYLRSGDASDLEQKSLNVGTDANGGYAVPAQLDANLRNYMFDANVMRQICEVVQATTGDYKIAVNTGGLAAGWVGETAARPETDTPTLAEVTPPTGELYANPAASQWMIDDAGFDLEGWLTREVQGKFASLEGSSFIDGNGTNKPKGVLDYPSATTDDDTRAFGTLKHTVAAGATAITADELINLTYDLRGVYRAGAVFLMNSKTSGYLMTLKSSDGVYLWQQSLQAGQPSQFAGFRVYVDEAMPDIGASATPVLCGNFRMGYRIIDRSPLRVLRDPYTQKPFVHFYSTKRVSGCLVDSNAIRILQNPAS